MVVLCRRPHQSILLPSINARIHVATVLPDVVRVAIDAPPEVAVLPGEAPTSQRPPQQPRVQNGRLVRLSRQRLRDVSVRVGLARLQLRVGQVAAVEAALEQVHGELQKLRRYLEAEEAGLQNRMTQARGTRQAARAKDHRWRALLAECTG
jgi:sRNA-binding carbon storage regulator CsrA